MLGVGQFFDLFLLLNESNQQSFLRQLNHLWMQKSRTHERDEYLSQWKNHETREHLLSAWKIAKPLAGVT